MTRHTWPVDDLLVSLVNANGNYIHSRKEFRRNMQVAFFVTDVLRKYQRAKEALLSRLVFLRVVVQGRWSCDGPSLCSLVEVTDFVTNVRRKSPSTIKGRSAPHPNAHRGHLIGYRRRELVNRSESYATQKASCIVVSNFLFSPPDDHDEVMLCYPPPILGGVFGSKSKVYRLGNKVSIHKFVQICFDARTASGRVVSSKRTLIVLARQKSRSIFSES